MKNQKTFLIKRIVHFVITAWLISFSFACTPTPTITVTNTPSPTSTPKPTSTATTQPSATLLPSPTPTPLVADLGNVIFSENFDDIDFPFGICGLSRIESGILIVERDPKDEANLCGMFSGGIYGQSLIQSDTTIVLLFKTTSDFNIGVHAGDYTNESLRRFSFGLSQGIGTWDLGIGQNVTSRQTHAVHRHSWYYFSIKISANGDVNAKLWERDNPKNITEFQGSLGTEWGTLPLTFVADFKDVPFLVDEYQVLQ